MFGIFKHKYPYSDKERTIIDSLEYPEYLGGLNEVIDRIKDSGYNKTILIDYAIRYNSIKIIKLVGMLTNSNKLFSYIYKDIFSIDYCLKRKYNKIQYYEARPMS